MDVRGTRCGMASYSNSMSVPIILQTLLLKDWHAMEFLQNLAVRWLLSLLITFVAYVFTLGTLGNFPMKSVLETTFRHVLYNIIHFGDIFYGYQEF